MTGSRAFSNASPLIPHLGRTGTRGVSGEVSDLRSDIEDGFHRLENRTGYPAISNVVGGSAISIAGSPVAADIKGANFTQSQTFATRACGTGNALVTFSANRPGEPGNLIETKIVTGAGSLTIGVVGQVITVTLASGGSTATDVAAAVNADAAANLLVHATAGGTGGSNVVAAAQAALTGGVGEGFSVKIGALEQGITDVVTNTLVKLSVNAFTGMANGDSAQLTLFSDGVPADPITVGIVT